MVVIPVTAGNLNRSIMVQASLGKKQDYTFRLTIAKELEMLLKSENLPSKHEVLSPNTTTVKIINK
jgi:hypothetical protein